MATSQMATKMQSIKLQYKSQFGIKVSTPTPQEGSKLTKGLIMNPYNDGILTKSVHIPETDNQLFMYTSLKSLKTRPCNPQISWFSPT